jgi:glycosyltransferase involved in cell wall biosynthesis
LEGGSHRRPGLRQAFGENSERAEEARLKADTVIWKIKDNVDFMSWLPQRKLFELYDSHDLLPFPSLHDSGGFVVLEALCHGMPVVCPDLGGPKEIVMPEPGLIIKTDGRNTTQVASSIANELYNVLQSPHDAVAAREQYRGLTIPFYKTGSRDSTRKL